MIWNWEIVWQFLPSLLKATIITVQATVLGTALAMVLGLFLAIGQQSGFRALRMVVNAVVEFVRSTPLLVQLVFAYAVLAPTSLSLLTIGVLVLGIHYSTYMAEVYRAGIEGVPKGQWEASTAISLSPARTWFAVILPQAVRLVIPALGNYFVAMFKETPLLLVIGVLELVGQAQRLGATNFRYLEAFTLAGVIFLVLSIPAAYLVSWLEKKFATQ